MATSLCNGCQFFFSHRQSKVGNRYHFQPAALDTTKRRESTGGRLDCSFCAYLCLVAPEHLSRPRDRGFDASLGLAVKPTWSIAMDLEHGVSSKIRRKSQGIDFPEMIVLRISSVGASEPFLQLSLLKRSGTFVMDATASQQQSKCNNGGCLQYSGGCRTERWRNACGAHARSL
jgi:hypothetical protein